MNKNQIISTAKEQIRPYVDRISVRAEAILMNLQFLLETYQTAKKLADSAVNFLVGNMKFNL